MQITSTLREFVTTNFYIPPDLKLDETTSFLDRGILDSTDVIELVTFVENQFGISVADDELVPAHFDSLGALTRFVERKRGAP
jgi:acyl carrier protein